MFFQVVSDIKRAATLFLKEQKISEDLLDKAPVFLLPEVIREYDELVFGSQIAIRLSFFLKNNGIDIGPERVAADLMINMISTPEVEYFLGRDVYVNAKPKLEGVFISFTSENLEFNNLPFLSLDSSVPRELVERVFGGAITPTFLESMREDFLSLIKGFEGFQGLSLEEQRQVYFTFLTDKEWEVGHFLAGYVSRENPLWLYRTFNEIIDCYFSVREVEGEYFEGKIKSALHTVPASHRALNEAKGRISTFLCLYDYLLVDSVKRDKVEIFWEQAMEMQKLLISLWNDPWIRLAIEGRSVKGDNGALRDIFMVLRVLRTAIDSLLKH